MEGSVDNTYFMICHTPKAVCYARRARHVYNVLSPIQYVLLIRYLHGSVLRDRDVSLQVVHLDGECEEDKSWSYPLPPPTRRVFLLLRYSPSSSTLIRFEFRPFWCDFPSLGEKSATKPDLTSSFTHRHPSNKDLPRLPRRSKRCSRMLTFRLQYMLRCHSWRGSVPSTWLHAKHSHLIMTSQARRERSLVVYM